MSYWWWGYIFPTNALLGTWKSQAVYQGDTLVQTFTVANPFAANNMATSAKNENAFTLSPNPAHNDLKIDMKSAGYRYIMGSMISTAG